MTDEPVAPPALVAATAALEKAADTLRSRVDLVGKALAAIATLGTGAVGLAEVSDLAPLRTGSDWGIAVLAILFLLLAAYYGVAIAIRLMQVGDPVVLDVEADLDELSSAERTDVARAFGSAASRHGFVSLAALQERERGLRKAAARAADDDERVRRTALADEIRLDIDHALASARVSVVRRRSTEAVSGSQSRLAYFLVAIGLVGFALFSDVVTSQRTDAVATAKACAEARTAGADEDDLVGTPCSAPPGPGASASADAASPAETRVALATQLLPVLAACVAAADDEATLVEDCATVRSAIDALLAE